jgi:tRNA 2-thiouridine synthesizing protein A
MKFDKELDVRGMACPMPVAKAKRALLGMSPGQVLKVIATDSGSVSDMNAFAEATGHELLSSEVSDKQFVFFLRR